VGKVLLLAKQTQVHVEKKRLEQAWNWHKNYTKKAEMPRVTFVGSLCKIYAVLCSKIADVHGIEVHDLRTWKYVYFRKFFRCLLHNTRDVMRWKGGTMPRAPKHCGEPKSHNNVTSSFFKIVHLLPKDLRFEHGGAKHVSCPRRHLTSLRSCTSRLSSQNGEICLKNTCSSLANYQSQNI